MYDCAIIGGGIAGLQAALQLGRYMHSVVVIDNHAGRSTKAKKYGNVLGWPDGISGPELRERGRDQARAVGVEFIENKAASAVQSKDKSFVITCEGGQNVKAKRLLISTGITDRIPSEIDGLHEVLGSAIYVCPDCDGYEIKDKKTVVLGTGNTGAAMACVLRYWSDQITYINHEPEKYKVSEHWKKKCDENAVAIIKSPIRSVQHIDSDQLSGIELLDGQIVEVEKGFIAFGGTKAESDIAAQLGVERLENGHIPVDGRTKETNVKHVWAAGDVAAHSQLLTVAIGDGAQAAIWIHKSLRE